MQRHVFVGNRRKKWALSGLILLLAVLLTACSGGGGGGDDEGNSSSSSGSGGGSPQTVDHRPEADCLECHRDQALEVHASLHYQWEAAAPLMVNGPDIQGKLTLAVNSYCINILGNWDTCGNCHVGKGERPELIPTQAQLENIDCLTCHTTPGEKPGRDGCLNCHAKAGGGDAVKRGDLALATISTTDTDYDVHMATTGANLRCQQCHHTEDHRIAGKGTDLRPTELDTPVVCTDCHASMAQNGHGSSTIRRHLEKVACQSCHIPLYAKNAADSSASEATETHRDWQTSHFNGSSYHPQMTLAGNLTPAYRFWNGTSNNYLLGDVASIDPATGRYPTSRPLGSIDDGDGKLYPFKYKTATQPLADEDAVLIALDTSVYFQTGDAVQATQAGLINMGRSGTDSYSWVETDTFQMLNHQVSPEDEALSCRDCHLGTARIDLQAPEVGYAPLQPRSTCATGCHKASKSDEWSAGDYEDFREHHDKHVRDEGVSCQRCHGFDRG